MRRERILANIWRYASLGVCAVCAVVLYSFYPSTVDQLVVWLLVGAEGLVAFFAFLAFLASERRRTRVLKDTIDDRPAARDHRTDRSTPDR